jgi:YegS/Rv2252/BmrU family lipid kinase
LVIVNPKSASGATQENWAAMAADFGTHFGPFSVEFTKGPGDGTELARQAAEAGREFIIACGGDGTINEVANGILLSGRDAELGVLPSGTGGDFRRSLGLPQTGRDAAAALRDGKTRRIDAGRVTFHDHDGREVSRYFLNVSSAGVAATIVKRVKLATAFDWLPADSVRGRVNFAVSTLQEVLDREPATVLVRIDDREEMSLRTIAFCVANSRYFGGGMMIAPDAKIDDGLFDVVNIGDMGTLKVLLNAWSLYRGMHQRLDEVRSTRARRVEIRPADEDESVLIETDGELPGKLPAVYEIVPGAIRVRVPRG